jgi:hypothetical protein
MTRWLWAFWSLVASLLSSSTAEKTRFLTEGTAPSTGQDWYSLDDHRTQFQPAATFGEDPDKTTTLRAAQRRLLQYDKQFIDGGETYYDEYAQAWRMIGMYIDCNVEEYSEEDRNENSNTGGCQRYLLWAAVSSFYRSCASF